jgi:hypothetical protein
MHEMPPYSRTQDLSGCLLFSHYTLHRRLSARPTGTSSSSAIDSQSCAISIHNCRITWLSRIHAKLGPSRCPVPASLPFFSFQRSNSYKFPLAQVTKTLHSASPEHSSVACKQRCTKPCATVPDTITYDELEPSRSDVADGGRFGKTQE